MTDCSCRSHSGFLTAKGLEEAAQREYLLDETVAVWPCSTYIDKVGSVSAFGHGPEPLWLEANKFLEQSERFLNGS